MANAAKSALGGAATGATVGAVAGPAGIAIGAGIGLLGGLVAYLIESGAEEEAAALMKEAADNYGNISDASVRAAAAKVLGPTALAQIQTDPAYRRAQDESLAALKNISDSGGLTLTDRANLNDVQAESAQAANSARQGQLADLSRRGMLGSGAEIASGLQNQQDAANRNSRAGLRVAGDAQERALQAIRERARLGGDMQRTEWDQKAQTARAQDAIDRFNNVEGYNRAADAYSRDLAMMDRKYRHAGDQAAAIRGEGQRDAHAVEQGSRTVGDAAIGIGAEYGRGQYQGFTNGEDDTGGYEDFDLTGEDD